MTDQILEYELLEHTQVLGRTVELNRAKIVALAANLSDRFRLGKRLLVCGNGGSAADAQHIAAEFINRFRRERQALPAIALTGDSSVLTCVGNDSSFDEVFARQVEGLASPGDILVGISTSGRSKNVLRALDAGRALGVITVGFTGSDGETMMGHRCDHCLVVPSCDTARIQEAYMFLWHVICGLVEARLCDQLTAQLTVDR